MTQPPVNGGSASRVAPRHSDPIAQPVSVAKVQQTGTVALIDGLR